jgi:hypothetical protein
VKNPALTLVAPKAEEVPVEAPVEAGAEVEVVMVAEAEADAGITDEITSSLKETPTQ